MIKIEGVTKKLGVFSLKDVSFTVPPGYICGLIGENGAGKTTLLRLLLGLYRPDAGRIEIAGHDISREERAAKNDIGYVLSEELFDRELTLLENAEAYGRYYERYDRERFLDYCGRFELEAKRKLKKHSKGEKLKFQFAFALAHLPKVLLLDEPTSGFDPEFRKEFLRILTEFIRDGEHSVLLATHLTSDLERLGDYITFLHQGKLVFSMDRETLENSFRLVSGEDYKLNLLQKDKVIYKEKGAYGAKALVRHGVRTVYDREVSVDVPTIEDIMYFMMKGEKHV